MKLIDYFIKNLKKFPDKIALVCDEQIYTYAQLSEKIKKLEVPYNILENRDRLKKLKKSGGTPINQFPRARYIFQASPLTEHTEYRRADPPREVQEGIAKKLGISARERL